MKILLISQYFWPESFGAGVWLLEMAEWLTRHGHQVTVLTGFPNHPEGRIFPEYRGRCFQRETYGGIRIIRTWLYAAPRTQGLFRRVLSQLSFALTSIFGGLCSGKQDVVLCFLPPLPIAASGWLTSKLHSARLVLSLQDVEPDRSIRLGLFRNPRLIRLLKRLERFAYVHADRICVLSPGMQAALVAKGVAPEKIRVTPNWANGDRIRPLPPSLSFRQELGLDSQFVALYAGNMGYTMGDLDTVVGAARLLASERNIHFILAGDGVRRASAAEKAQGLPNVHFLPIQPLERFPSLLATADVALVLLSPAASQASVPGKIYSAMAAGRAVVAICEPQTDTARLVHEARCGTQVVPGDAPGLANLLCAYRDQRERAAAEGRQARSYFEQHFTHDVCIAAYKAVLAETC